MSTAKQSQTPKRYGLRLARQNPADRGISQDVNGLRRDLEQAVCDSYGQVSLQHAATIQSACRHEKAARTLERWLRVEQLGVPDKLRVMQDIGRATDQRDRCIRALNLPQPDAPPDPSDPATLYVRSQPLRQPAVRCDPEQDSAHGPGSGATAADSGAL